MLRRALVSACSGSGLQRRPHATQLSVTGSDSNGSAAAKQTGISPRDDLDLTRQRAMVEAEKRRRREQWLATQVSAHTESLEYRRHALRLLVINAAHRQLQQQRSSGDGRSPNASPEPEAVPDPSALDVESPLVDSAAPPSPRGAPTANAEKFDLTRQENLKNLLNDIDIVIRLASERPASTQQKMLGSTLDQIAKLDLWTH